MKEKGGIIEQIHAKNTVSIPDLNIKWIGWLVKPAFRKKKSSLIIKYKIAVQANGAIEKDLVIRPKLYWCTLYNLVCK